MSDDVVVRNLGRSRAFQSVMSIIAACFKQTGNTGRW